MNRGAVRLITLLASLLLLATNAQSVRAAAPSSSPGFLGIRLLDVPAALSTDPRAQIYIIDHLAPGTTIQRRIEVSTTAAGPSVVDTYVGAASISGDTFGGAPDRTQNELSSWMSVNHSSVSLVANGEATVDVTIQVPSRASSGERYAVIWAQTSSPSPSQKGVLLVNRVGVRVYLDVGPGGDPPSDFDIQNLSGARTNDGQPEVIAQVKNTGQRALDMSGELQLSGGPGALSAGPFPAQTGSTLAPAQTANVTVLLSRQLPNGPWKADLTLTSGLLQHSASATIQFPAARGTINQPQMPDGFKLNPIILGLGGLVLLAAVSTWRWRVRRTKQRRLFR